MSVTFDLAEEAWIPVRRIDGSDDILSILDALKQADQIAEISDPSAMIEYGLYRLLAVVLMDALRPKNDNALRKLLARGSFDPAVLESYISICRTEGATFDIFDEERPFLQARPHAAWDGVRKPVSILDYTLPTGGNHTHFDHRSQNDVAMTYAEAARRLPSIQLFCTAAVQGYPSTINGAPPYYILMRGDTLFETLVLSMISEQTAGTMSFDAPPVWWRSDSQIEPKAAVVQTSLLFGALFPARRVRLIPHEGCVREVYFMQGLNFDKSTQAWTDPHVAYGYDKKTGRYNWKPHSGSAVWRNIGMLTLRGSLPQILRQYANRPDAKALVRLQVYGVETSQASYLDSRRFELQLPDAIVGNDEAAQSAMDAVGFADEIAGLVAATVKFADSDVLIKPIVSAAKQLFYDKCEARFWEYLQRLAQDPDAAADEWFHVVEEAAKHTLSSVTRSLRLKGTDLMRLQRNAGKLFGRLKKIRTALQDTELEEEPQEA